MNIKSLDYHFEELEIPNDTFRENKPTFIRCSETWMVEYSASSAFSLEVYAAMEIETGSTRNESVAIYVHELFYLEPLELSVQTESFPDLNYTGVICTKKNKEKLTVVR